MGMHLLPRLNTLASATKPRGGTNEEKDTQAG